MDKELNTEIKDEENKEPVSNLEANTASNNIESDPVDDKSGDDNKTFTKEEVQALIKEALKDYVSKDKVNEIVIKEKNKAKRKADEASRLAELTREQLLEEIDKINTEKEALARDKEELESLKAESLRISKENAISKLKLETKSALNTAGLSEEYFDLVFNEDSTAEDINAKIQQLSKLVNAEKKKEKENIVKGAAKVPKSNNGNKVLNDKERFRKMSLSERQELKNKDPELYRRLSGK